MRTIQSELGRIQLPKGRTANERAKDSAETTVLRGLATERNTGITQDASDIGYPIQGAVADRDEFQRLLERCFESSRRRREDQEYEEWLAQLRREGQRSMDDVELCEDCGDVRSQCHCDLDRTQGS